MRGRRNPQSTMLAFVNLDEHVPLSTLSEPSRKSPTMFSPACHESYRASQKVRKRVELIFGWMKTVGRFCWSRYVGVKRTGLCGELVATTHNLVRMSRLIAEEGGRGACLG